MKPNNPILTDAQLAFELNKCEFCEEKPCREGCPAHCSPADFIRFAHVGEPSDIARAAAEIMTANPFGGVCGLVCPDRHCQAACVYKKFNSAVEIPAVQATLIAKAKALGVMPKLPPVASTGKKVAVVGAGPAGLAAAAMLARHGHAVNVFERETTLGGACRLIPPHRLPRDVLDSDIDFLLSLGDITIQRGKAVTDPTTLLSSGFDGVVVASGLTEPIGLGMANEDMALRGLDYLRAPDTHPLTGKNVAVVGGGATAVDCAATARLQGAASVEMFCLERLDEMPLTARERTELLEHHVALTGRVRLSAIHAEGGRVNGIETIKIDLPEGTPFSPAAVRDVPGSVQHRLGFDAVIVAIGARRGLKRMDDPRITYAGDFDVGPSTVVTASAGGKNAALELHASLTSQPVPEIPDRHKSRVRIPGYDFEPVPLTTNFFGRIIPSPFLLSAAPPSDGYDQMTKAYQAGWAGGIMKTAFDNVPIHIPGEYMHAFDRLTYGNCDNVSGHALDRVCREIERLVREWPDRLTAGSTGGPVTGNDESDRKGWQSNTKKLEAAGAMAIEYSLSCPQGGDGTEGDIVSQNAALTAKIIDWVMSVGDPEVPKLFKLTAAVTSVAVILRAVKAVFDRYPNKKAGVTLANTFPTLCFRPGEKKEWEEGIVVGMSGEGVTPISNLTLATVGNLGVTVSGNGGPMDHKSAAHFLALGARTVQFCTVVMKHGYGVVEDLHSGLSHLMAARGIRSVEELIGIAQPRPVRDFMALTPIKKISDVNKDLCESCGNCTRCPYLAITLDADRHPVTDPARCIGCSICVQKCFAKALFMRPRTAEETRVLRED